MKYLLVVLLCISLVHANSKLVKKEQFMIVNEINQKALGDLPVGTIVVLDKKTQLYRPPALSEVFSVEDRMTLMWNKKDARDNFCKVGPDRLYPDNWKWNYFWFEFCRSQDGEDICCGDGVCTCYSMGFGTRFSCSCVNPETAEYYEEKQKEDSETLERFVTEYRKHIGRMVEAVGRVGLPEELNERLKSDTFE